MNFFAFLFAIFIILHYIERIFHCLKLSKNSKQLQRIACCFFCAIISVSKKRGGKVSVARIGEEYDYLFAFVFGTACNVYRCGKSRTR